MIVLLGEYCTELVVPHNYVISKAQSCNVKSRMWHRRARSATNTDSSSIHTRTHAHTQTHTHTHAHTHTHTTLVYPGSKLRLQSQAGHGSAVTLTTVTALTHLLCGHHPRPHPQCARNRQSFPPHTCVRSAVSHGGVVAASISSGAMRLMLRLAIMAFVALSLLVSVGYYWCQSSVATHMKAQQDGMFGGDIAAPACTWSFEPPPFPLAATAPKLTTLHILPHPLPILTRSPSHLPRPHSIEFASIVGYIPILRGSVMCGAVFDETKALFDQRLQLLQQDLDAATKLKATAVATADTLRGHIAQLKGQLSHAAAESHRLDAALQVKTTELQAKATELQAKTTELQAKATELQVKTSELEDCVYAKSEAANQAVDRGNRLSESQADAEECHLRLVAEQEREAG